MWGSCGLAEFRFGLIEATEEVDMDPRPHIPFHIHCSPASVECSGRPFFPFLWQSSTQLSQLLPKRNNCRTTSDSALQPPRLGLAYDKLTKFRFPPGAGEVKNLPIDSEWKSEGPRLECCAIEKAETTPNFFHLLLGMLRGKFVLWPDAGESRSKVRLTQPQ